MTACTSSYILFKSTHQRRGPLTYPFTDPVMPDNVVFDKERIDEGDRNRAQQRPAISSPQKNTSPRISSEVTPTEHGLLARR